MIKGAVLAVLAMLLGACTVAGADELSGSARPPVTPSGGPYVVHFTGHGNVHFGDSRADLEKRGVLRTNVAGCAPQLATAAELGPVFDGDRLVLLWVNPPYGTAEHIAVGSTVADVHRTYPAAITLTPPAGSFTFPGLLVVQDDRAYLFLHDEKTVQKVVVGYHEHVRRLFEQGFGTC